MNKYSKKAIPQLETITSQSGELLYRRCPYQAKVIKVFEIVKSTTGSQREFIKSFINGRVCFFLPKTASHRQRCAPRNGKCSRPAPHLPCLPATPRPCVRGCLPPRWPPPAPQRFH